MRPVSFHRIFPSFFNKPMTEPTNDIAYCHRAHTEAGLDQREKIRGEHIFGGCVKTRILALDRV